MRGRHPEFYSMHDGDLRYTKQLADEFTISDNYHQAVQGGTGANHVAMMTGDAVWYSDGEGHVAVPPADQIENPDPAPGTNNCTRRTATPAAPTAPAPTLRSPEWALRTIGDELIERDVSWSYFGDQFDNYLADHDLYGTISNQYCDICNAFQYSTAIMADAAVRTEPLHDTQDLYADIADGFLPAVCFVKPSGLVDGHPASSKWDLFEGFSRKIIDSVRVSAELWDSAAILVTADEGGGYWDSGYVQPVDFFGDGTRIPMIAVSKYSRDGHVSHQYNDHVSILKFIERNWDLPPVTFRSRDNLPTSTELHHGLGQGVRKVLVFAAPCRLITTRLRKRSSTP